MPWCGIPPRSSGVGLAVPMSIPRYPERESMEMISPPSRRATSIDSAVFPDAVGPTIASARGMGDGSRISNHASCGDAEPLGGVGGSSAAPEAAVQLGQGELDHRGTAVDVVVGELGGEKAVEELRHLPLRELLPRLDGALARHGERDPLVLRARALHQRRAVG